jgi:hypothetical protein
MRTPVTIGLLLLFSLLCACGPKSDASAPPTNTPPSIRPPAPQPPVVEAAPFEVHEWGLVRGGANDTIVVGASLPQLMPMAVAKPVLYFHLGSEAPVEVSVTARMGEGGTIVESWPIGAAPSARFASWSARVTRGSCHHGRLPSFGDAPCLGLNDGCEAATLDTVESDDADCVMVGPQSANHLFYRGSLTGVDPLPLVVERLPDGRVRVRNRGTEPIPGALLRVRLGYGAPRVSDGATSAPAPGPGATVEIGVPAGTTAAAAEQSGAMLRELGLTVGETAAFRRAWDTILFGLPDGAAAADLPLYPAGPRPVQPVHAEAARPTAVIPTIVTAAPVAGAFLAPQPSDSLIYFLPPSVIEKLSTLELAPRPTRTVRVIAVWLELPAP